MIIAIYSCSGNTSDKNLSKPIVKKDSIFTAYSNLENQYDGFQSPDAINKIANIENDHFNLIEDSISPYYGTVWALMAGGFVNNQEPLIDQYLKEIDQYEMKADSMHCTIYAVEALKAGLGNQFAILDSLHQAIWNKREYAGWSIGHLLTENFGWKAFVVVDSSSLEFKRCIDHFQENREYYVWRQPSISVEELYIRGQDDSKIEALLKQNEFGWGFSYQGYHTWITRFSDLKECMWDGAPSKKYDLFNGHPLFRTTLFLDFGDYDSHVIVFPPKKT